MTADATDPAAAASPAAASPAPAWAGPEPEFDGGPVVTPARTVPPEWIDYNGHMNVAYYTMAFDKSSDHVFDHVLGVGEALARELRNGPMVVQQMIHYVGELLEGEAFECHMRLLDHGPKRIHMFSEMRKVSDGSLCATSETLTLNVDLERRRSTPYPDWAQARLARMAAAQAHLPRPEQAGAQVGIRRKG